MSFASECHILDILFIKHVKSPSILVSIMVKRHSLMALGVYLSITHCDIMYLASICLGSELLTGHSLDIMQQYVLGGRELTIFE